MVTIFGLVDAILFSASSYAQSSQTEDPTESEIIPIWIKNNFRWFSEGAISEGEILNALKFLIDNNIIQIDMSVYEPQTKTFDIEMDEIKFLAEVEVNDEETIGTVEMHKWNDNLIIVNKGDTVILNITNPKKFYHTLEIPEFDIETGLLEPGGGSETIQFVADKSGVFTFACGLSWDPSKLYCAPDHNMQTGTIIVLE